VHDGDQFGWNRHRAYLVVGAVLKALLVVASPLSV
jgi:hypothetical protein